MAVACLGIQRPDYSSVFWILYFKLKTYIINLKKNCNVIKIKCLLICNFNKMFIVWFQKYWTIFRIA